MTPTLRPYQLAAVEAIRARYRAGDRRTLLVLPTGTGKTVVFADIARRVVERGGRVLVLAHRTELLEQARAKLRAVGVTARIEKASQRAGDADVVVASVQTLKGKRLAAWDPDAFHQIIVDEAHHSAAAGYRAILDHFARAYVLGVTATPDRLDGQALGDQYQSCAYQYELRQAIRDGYLAPIRARRIEVDGVDLAAVHTRAGDLDRAELAAVMETEAALHGVAAPLLEQSGTRRTVLFCVDRAHAVALADVLNRYQPGVARSLDGTASDEERASTLAAFRAGRFRILANVALLTEGWDEPSVECVAMARPTKSRGLYTQCVGRGTRLSPDTGKTDCLVLDFAGNAGRHRLVGPADVLGGADLDDEIRAEAERLLAEGQLELDELLEAADAAVQERRAKAGPVAVARYLATEIDPFVGELPPAFGEHRPWMDAPASASQRKQLQTLGVAVDDLPAMTGGDASRILAELHRRRHEGLCSLRQARVLRRAGFDTRRMTFSEAGRLLSVLRDRGWEALREMAHNRRGSRASEAAA